MRLLPLYNFSLPASQNDANAYDRYESVLFRGSLRTFAPAPIDMIITFFQMKLLYEQKSIRISFKKSIKF